MTSPYWPRQNHLDGSYGGIQWGSGKPDMQQVYLGEYRQSRCRPGRNAQHYCQPGSDCREPVGKRPVSVTQLRDVTDRKAKQSAVVASQSVASGGILLSPRDNRDVPAHNSGFVWLFGLSRPEVASH